MLFSINNSLEILKRTPLALHSLLYDVNEQWSNSNEGINTWSPFDVVGHLIHCEEFDWIPRIKIILSNNDIKKFEPLDRFAQIQKNKGKSLNQLLDEFVKIRYASLESLKSLNITEEQLSKIAIHPELGTVTLSQLISTWVGHDLNHTAQIARILAAQYKDEVGPWVKYMRVLKS